MSTRSRKKCFWEYAKKMFRAVDASICVFLTSAISLDEWTLSRSAALPSGKELLVTIGWEEKWAPEPAWTTWRRRNN
jgi:hypothetical protein